MRARRHKREGSRERRVLRMPKMGLLAIISAQTSCRGAGNQSSSARLPLCARKPLKKGRDGSRRETVQNGSGRTGRQCRMDREGRGRRAWVAWKRRWWYRSIVPVGRVSLLTRTTTVETRKSTYPRLQSQDRIVEIKPGHPHEMRNIMKRK
jgi:hypothetical protein